MAPGRTEKNLIFKGDSSILEENARRDKDVRIGKCCRGCNGWR